MIVELWCDCYTTLATFQVVKQCTWAFRDSAECPPLSESDRRYDWECDPRVENCPSDQYPSVLETTAITTHNDDGDFQPVKVEVHAAPPQLFSANGTNFPVQYLENLPEGTVLNLFNIEPILENYVFANAERGIETENDYQDYRDDPNSEWNWERRRFRRLDSQIPQNIHEYKNTLHHLKEDVASLENNLHYAK